MNVNQLTNLLDEHGHYHMANKIYNQLLSTNLIAQMDVDIMDTFLSLFEMNEETSVEEFVSLYKMFSAIYEKDKFPVIF